MSSNTGCKNTALRQYYKDKIKKLEEEGNANRTKIRNLYKKIKKLEKEECVKPANEWNIIEPPEDVELPFFAYGFYKPHQLAFPSIKEFVKGEPVKSKVKASLKQVNGVPVLVETDSKHGYVEGYLIYFKEGYKKQAYEKVGYSRNRGIYEWKEMNIDGKKANVLISSKPKTFKNRGNWNYEFNERKYIKELNIYLESYDWRKDPIFEKPIDYIFMADHLRYTMKIRELNIEEPINHSDLANNNQKTKKHLEYEFAEFFETQMLYMLLWTSIDRFLTFRYGETKKNNVIFLSEEESFKTALKKYVKEDEKVFHDRKTVYSIRDLRTYELNPNKPTCSAMFYYTIRNNVVHSGKVLIMEQMMLSKALKQLARIFNDVVEAAKKE